jgi:hypothetical protein
MIIAKRDRHHIQYRPPKIGGVGEWRLWIEIH